MATSPIYNWPEPDNTDLVKNGALAMRTLGDAIDTTMATMTPKSTYTAKGSIAAATAASTPANLTVGNNGETLVADSTATTGLRWTATPSGSNPVLNSAMNVWQRGTSIATGTTFTYGADRWQSYRGSLVAGLTVSRQATGDTTNLPNIQYCARIQRDSGNTSANSIVFYQCFESINSIPFAGKTVTLSFYARKGANFSQASSTFNAVIKTGTGTDQNLGSAGYTGTATPLTTTPTLTTTWQRFQVTGTIAATATEMTVQFDWIPAGTAGAADYVEVTGVQLDVGNTALPFRTAGVSYQQELAACQRYCYNPLFNETGSNKAVAPANAISTTQAHPAIQLPSMRTAPSVTITATDFSLGYTGGSALTAFAVQVATPTMFLGLATVASGLTANAGYNLYRPGTTSNIIFSAEL